MERSAKPLAKAVVGSNPTRDSNFHNGIVRGVGDLQLSPTVSATIRNQIRLYSQPRLAQDDISTQVCVHTIPLGWPA